MTLQELPVEILRKILRHATEVPKLLDTTNRTVNYEGDNTMDCRPTGLRGQYMKTQLAAVSRLIRAISQEFFYEGVVIGEPFWLSEEKEITVSRIRQRANLLHESQVGRPPRGWWVKWLLIRLSLNDSVEKLLEGLDTFWGITSSCPNIQVLRLFITPPSFSTHTRLPPSDVVALTVNALDNMVSSFGTMLRYLEVGRGISVPAKSLVRLMEKCPHLEHLSLRGLILNDLTSDLPTSHNAMEKSEDFEYTFHHLHTLCLHSGDVLPHEVSLWHLPGLRHLGLEYTTLSPEKENTPSSTLIDCVKMQIRTLELGKGRDGSPPSRHNAAFGHSKRHVACPPWGSGAALHFGRGLVRAPQHPAAESHARAYRYEFWEKGIEWDCPDLDECDPSTSIWPVEADEGDSEDDLSDQQPDQDNGDEGGNDNNSTSNHGTDHEE